MRRLVLSVLTLFIALVAFPASAFGQERPEPPTCAQAEPCWWPVGAIATLERFEADLDVTDGVLRARYRLNLTNRGDGMAEGRIVVPVPPGSSVVDLVLSGGPETLEGKVLDAAEAERIYEDIVRRMIDPALLRSLGDDLFEVRAFPVPPGESLAVSFTVTTPLTAIDEQALIEIPWSRMSPRPLSATVEIAIDVPWEVRSALAPGRSLEVEREGDGHLTIGWESSHQRALESDFRLYLAGGEGLLSTRVLTHREAGEDGYFALLFAPAIDVAERVDRDIVLVLDTSGSMEGAKLEQAKRAAAYVLERLGEGDRFGVVTFSRTVDVFGEGLHRPNAAADAIAYVEGLYAAGGTNIAGALERAFDLVGGSRPSTLIFLTDGLPSIGPEDAEAILAIAQASAPERAQLFAFGVGFDVDTILLDALASEFVGSSHYVTEGESIDSEVSRLFERISTPILTDVEIRMTGTGTYDLAPGEIRGLFAGTQTLLTGRYREAGALRVEVSGNTANGRETFVYELTLPERDLAEAAVAQLWAQRRVADLLTELRIEGPRESLVEEIVAIATRFGIVTPYTSYLAEEPVLSLGSGEQAVRSVTEAAGAPTSGEAAVAGADSLESLRDGDFAAGGERIRVLAAHSYILVDGTWIESAYDGTADAPEVAVGSAAFAELLAAQPELAGAAALGERVLVNSKDGWVTLVWPDAEAGGEVVVPDVRPETSGGGGGVTQIDPDRAGNGQGPGDTGPGTVVDPPGSADSRPSAILIIAPLAAAVLLLAVSAVGIARSGRGRPRAA